MKEFRSVDGDRVVLFPGPLAVREPEATREERLANLLLGICILAPRLRSPDAQTRMEARMVLDVHCTMARKLGVHRPIPPPEAS